MKIVLGGWKKGRSLHLPIRIFKVYVKALAGFIHVHHSEGLNSTLLLQGFILETGPN